jgi:hypothetical protein
MAKPTELQWQRAKSLYEADKSLREIEKETNINYRTIDRQAKKEGWKKGSLSQLIVDAARVQKEFVTLDATQQQIVSQEVSQRLRHEQFFTNATLKNLTVMMKKVDDTASIAEHSQAQTALAKGKEVVLGKAPDTAVQINNNNALNLKSLTDDELAQMEALLDKTSKE